MRWQCKKCKHVAFGSEAPDKCPVCGASTKDFVPFNGVEGLAGSRTEANLKAAFGGEAQANRRYTAYEILARAEGNEEAAEAFARAAADETAHALSHLAYLGWPGATAHNLKAAIEGESYENESMYPEFARVAREEGFEDIARYFESVARHELRHANAYKAMLEKLEINI